MRILLAGLVCAAASFAEEWKAGPLTLEVHIARTANVFHVVDNLSNWDRYAHAQYAEHFRDLTDRDRGLLRLHAAIRRKKGWGGGLEQTFYTTAKLDAAIAAGIAAGHLTKAEAEREALVLRHFAERADGLLERERERLVEFRGEIQRKLPDLAQWCAKISRFCHGHQVKVPVYLIANPSATDWGGGYNGGRLTLEVPGKTDAYPTFLHELMHAFVTCERARLEAAVGKVEGLDYTTLNEGIAYALSPGLIHAGSSLRDQAARDFAGNKSMKDPYVRFRRYGVALMPLLREALDGSETTLETFLPRALDVWKSLAALENARTGGRRKGQRRNSRAPLHFSAGPGWKTLGRRVGLSSFNHSADHYKQILARAKPGETFVLLYALDHPDRKRPREYADLLPVAWSDVEKALKAGEVVEAEKKARKLRIVLLAAPTTAGLEKLIRTTKRIRRQRGPWFFNVGGGMNVYKALNNHLYKVHGRGTAGYSPHSKSNYEKMLGRGQKGDTVILLFAKDELRAPPETMRDFLPLPWKRIRFLLDQPGGKIEAEGTARGYRTVLLAADAEESLIRLIRRTSLLSAR